MNAENLSEAYYINNEIKELQRQKSILESGAGLGVTIQSTYQDNAFWMLYACMLWLNLIAVSMKRKLCWLIWEFPSLNASRNRAGKTPPEALRSCAEQ
jgi:hypothetical protein